MIDMLDFARLRSDFARATSALEFDSAKHEYHYGGARVIGVTSALKAAGIIDDTWFTADGSIRGTAVHRAIELHLAGTLDAATVDAEIKGYYHAALQCLAEHAAITAATELRLYNPSYRYAGTADWIGMFDGIMTIVDWKTGAAQAWWALQSSLYMEAYNRTIIRAGINLEFCAQQRICVELSPSGFRLHTHRSGGDLRIALAAVEVAQWRAAQ